MLPKAATVYVGAAAQPADVVALRVVCEHVVDKAAHLAEPSPARLTRIVPLKQGDNEFNFHLSFDTTC